MPCNNLLRVLKSVIFAKLFDDNIDLEYDFS